ncbi:MAG: hypothetical protein MUP74_04985, partial [Desulfobacterales bacterium]|nr:hypothetical protein [Desulfobacterales bacterium]
MVKAQNPLLSTADIKAVIAGTVDPIPALNGITVSGGRLNAFGAVTAPGSGILQFSAPDYTVYEDGGFAEITVTRTGGSDGTVSVIYAASDGTATQGADFAETGGTLSWDGGESGDKTFTVPIINDDITESSETIVLTLSLSDPQSGAILGSLSTAVLTIFDDDYRPGILQFSPAAVAVSENAGSVTLTVTRT